MVSLLVSLVILCLIVWAVRSLLAAVNVGEPITTIVHVVLVVVVVLWLLSAFGLWSGGPLLRWR